MPYETHKHYDFDFDAENVCEDFLTIAEMIGIEVYSRRGKSPMDGIHYSGFWSQGDGASFEGRYRYKAGALKAVQSYAALDTKLHAIVERLQSAQRRTFYQTVCTITTEGNYSHSGTMMCEFENATDANRYDSEAEKVIKAALRSLADWLYVKLEEAYEYGASYAMGRYIADKQKAVKTTRADLLVILKDYRPIRKACLSGNSLCGVIQSRIQSMLHTLENLRKDISQTLKDNRTDEAYFEGLKDGPDEY